MQGYVIMKLKAEVLGTNGHCDDSQLSAVEKLDGDNQICRDEESKLLLVRKALTIMPGEFSLTWYDDYCNLPIIEVHLIAYTHVNVQNESVIKCGIISSFDHRKGALVCWDSSENDPHRLRIEVKLNNLQLAVELLYSILTGKEQPKQPWLI